MKINSNIGDVKESATLAINQQVKRLREANQPISHFGFGESPFPLHEKIAQALAEHNKEKSYLPGLGLLALRETIAAFQNNHFATTFTTDDIAVAPGSKMVIFQALMLLEGDILLPNPSWVSYAPQAMLIGKDVIAVETTFDTEYKINPETLHKALQNTTAKQHILILNSANNPTGQVYCEAELTAIAEVCRQHNIIVISDEIYALVSFAKPAPSIAQCCPERVIVTSGLSKAFSAGGYRFGFLACKDNHFMKQLTTLISETFSCVSSPVQYAALAAYQNDSEIMQYVSDCNAIHYAVLNFAAQRFRAMRLRCLNAQSGFYLFPDFSAHQQTLQQRGIDNSEQLCKRLLNEINVALLPGEDFGCDGRTLAVRAAMVDYDGDTLYQHYINDDNFQINPYIPNIVTGLERLTTWLN